MPLYFPSTAPAVALNDLTDVDTTGFADENSLTYESGSGLWVPQAITGSVGLLSPIEFIIDGGGSAITTGIKGYIEMAFNGTITANRLLADQLGSIVIDLWKDTYANFPPVVGDTITASAKPTISAATKSQDTTLTGWTTSFSAGDIIAVNVDSITTLTRVTLSLTVART